MKENRRNMILQWGQEVVVKCCRYWKLHYADGKWGVCGICHERPKYVSLTWDELDLINEK